MSLEHLVVPKSNKVLKKKKDRGMLQGHRCQLEEAPAGQIGDNLSTKIRTLMN